jgi:hypothetical protein
VTIEAPDEKAAEAQAVKVLGLAEEQHRRLSMWERDRISMQYQNRAADRNSGRHTGPHQTAAQCLRHVINKSCAYRESAECQPAADQSQQSVHRTNVRLVARPVPPGAK